MATDAELNSYVSLRKMAPYRFGDDESKKSKNKKRLKELRDALKTRKWGVADEDAEGRADAGRERKKAKKWSEENGRKKEGASGTESKAAVKRVGKKERERRKKAAAQGGDAAAAVEE